MTEYIQVSCINSWLCTFFCCKLDAHVLESTVTVFMTDYESFAIISNCDKESNSTDLQFTQHATLWSRTRDLDNYFIEKVHIYIQTRVQQIFLTIFFLFHNYRLPSCTEVVVHSILTHMTCLVSVKLVALKVLRGS